MKLTEQQKIRNKWVKALTSGKYKQGKSFLRKKRGETERFCCLGVLCELAVKAKVIPAPELKDQGIYEYIDYNQAGLPQEVKNWVGLSGEYGEYKVGTVTLAGKVLEDNSLASLNDKGTKFKTIAKLIQNPPEGLFNDDTGTKKTEEES